MPSNLSRAPLFVRDMNLGELNRVLAQIREELDQLQGLRGEIVLYGTMKIKDDDGNVIHGFGDVGG